MLALTAQAQNCIQIVALTEAKSS